MPHSAQLAFNLPFDSARWKGSKYSQYFGLSLKPGNRWCFLLIREFVGKCRTLLEVVRVKRFLLLGGHYGLLVVLGSRPSPGVVKSDWESARSRGSFWWLLGLGLYWETLKSRGSSSWVVVLGGVKGVVPLSSYLGQVSLVGRRGQGGHPLGWLLGMVGVFIAVGVSSVGESIAPYFDLLLENRPSLGVIKVKRVVLLIGYYIFL
ncbi:hypothetical protein EDB89DRAFT_1910772 [Lactarius sanguifluus]|nr:hypothetical protein EDB89DRAFT_1910772 [Lactarius sanguifluus]